MNIRITERDIEMMKIITKYRFMTANQIRILAGFSSLNTCDRRLKKLIETKYIIRKYFLYGMPALYFVSKQAQVFFNLEYITTNVRLNTLEHDIQVINTAIYFIKKMNIQENDIITERELRHEDGFAVPKHKPDFIYAKNCVEVELSEKSKIAFKKIVQDNYLTYDTQYWITDNPKVKRNLEEMQKSYGNIEIIKLKEVQEYVKSL